MKKFVCLFIFYLFKVFAAVDPAALVTVDASPIFAGCVNAITGKLVLNQTDLVIPAAEPIIINRSYASSNTLEYDGGWDFFSYYKMRFQYPRNSPAFVQFLDPLGFQVILPLNKEETLKEKKEKLIYKLDEDAPKGMTNAFGILSGTTNIKNYVFIFHPKDHYGELTTGDGTKRLYHMRKKDVKADYIITDHLVLYLKQEIKPNGNIITYQTDHKDRLELIETKSPTGKSYVRVEIKNSENKKKDHSFSIQTSDGRSISYSYEKFPESYLKGYFYLKTVKGCGIDDIYYNQTGYKEGSKSSCKKSRGPYLKHFDSHGKKVLWVEHYSPHNNGDGIEDCTKVPCDRVKEISYPDEHGNLRTLYHFIYHREEDDFGNLRDGSYTEIVDFMGNKTTYYYDHREILNEIAYHSRGTLIKREKFQWDGTNLSCKLIHDYISGKTAAKKFEYSEDGKGNVKKETFYGDLSGDHNYGIFSCIDYENKESFSKAYKYNKDNLPEYVVDQNGLKISYTYKDGTDLIKSKITSKGEKIYLRKFYTYDDDNLLKEEIEDDGTTLKDDSTYQTRKIKKITPNPEHGLLDEIQEYYVSSNGQKVLLSSIQYKYNGCRLVEKESRFDENSKEIATITREYYENTCQLKSEEFLGADGIKRTTRFQYEGQNLKSKKSDESPIETHYEYDGANRLWKKEEKAGNISYVTEYKYDLYGNKISETDFRENETQFSYDYLGNIAKTLVPQKSVIPERGLETVTLDGVTDFSWVTNLNHYSQTKGKVFVHDNEGNIFSFTNFDERENWPLIVPPYKIPITYHLISSEIHEPSSYELKNYFTSCQKSDIYGNPLKKRDPLGNTTIFAYNAYGSPIKITHPDGKAETFVYFPDGKLKEKTDTSKVVTTYEYDDLGRETNKTIFSPNGEKLAEETKTYDSFHLRTFKDAEGHLTEYFYDAAGRKSKEVTNDRETHFSYDSAGRLYAEATLIDGKYLVTITERNSLNEVIEKRIEERVHPDMEGTVLGKTTYTYYDTGKLKEEIEHISANKISKQSYVYDDFGRLISSTNSFGHTTTVTYDDYSKDDDKNTVLKVTTTDPLNVQTIQTMNMQGEVGLEEKKNASTTLSKEKFFYDDAKNLVKQESSIIYDGEETHKITTAWEYDNMQRLEKLTEAKETPEEKVTEYEYTAAGQIENITKPDGTLLIHKYNDLGYLTHLESNDGSIHHEFKVDLLGNIEEAIDHNSKLKKTTCKYDDFGNLEMETLQNGLTLQKNYDSLDRLQKITFHDGTVVEKVYDALYLKKVIRKDSEGHELYSHLYQEYDLSGNLCKESLPENLGEIIYNTDDSGRINSIISPYHQETITKQDPLGRTKAIERLHSSSSYEYDDLGQLISEEGLFSHSYGYDSHHCRQVSDDSDLNYNSLHQLKTIDDETSIEYDPNGNPQKKSFPEGEIIYTCDKLDRLISYEIPGRIYAEYTYDPFHRRMSKRLVYPDGTEAMQFFLYDGDNEIGSTDTSGTIRELRILGHTARAERSAVAFELHGKTYFPLPDLFGNVSCLLSKEGRVESYEYDAFGNENVPEDPISPWRYAAKRVDFESDLIYFGRRYYDPVVGIWLTPDPAGYTKGLNLYAYVCNDPLMSFDLYGLLLCTPNPFEHGDKSSTIVQNSSETVGNLLTLVNNPYFHGSMQAFGGLIEIGVGGALAYGSGGSFSFLGWPIMAHGLDHLMTGINTLRIGIVQDTQTSQLLQKTGLSRTTSNSIDTLLSFGGPTGATALIRYNQWKALSYFRVPKIKGALKVANEEILIENVIQERINVLENFHVPAKRNTGITIIGHYPEYVKISEKLLARRFQIPNEIWKRMSFSEQISANEKFLERTILRGDEIFLATPLNQVKPGSFFAWELEFLIEKGYKVEKLKVVRSQ